MMVKPGVTKHPKEPALRTKDLLLWIYRERPDGFTVEDLLERFAQKDEKEAKPRARGEFQRRVNYMRYLWGTVRPIGKQEAHRRGRKRILYRLTDWGQRYAKQALKSGN